MQDPGLVIRAQEGSAGNRLCCTLRNHIKSEKETGISLEMPQTLMCLTPGMTCLSLRMDLSLLICITHKHLFVFSYPQHF